MINLRFHIVSLVAVFLALAIGILTGSTLLDRATIQVLEDRQASLDNRNTELRDELGAFQDNTRRRDKAQNELDERALDELVPGLLSDDAVLVVAARGIDETTVTRLEQVLSDAGATSLGTVWIDDRLDLVDGAIATKAATALSLPASSTSSKVVETLAERLTKATPAAAVAPDPAEPVDPLAPPTVTEPVVSVPLETLSALREASLIDWVDANGNEAAFSEFPEGPVRLIVLSGEGAELSDASLISPLVAAISAQRPGVIFGEVLKPRSDIDQIADGVEERRGATVDAVRSDAELSNRVITIDNVDEVWGKLAVVFSLTGTEPLKSGAFGVATSAAQVLPDYNG